MATKEFVGPVDCLGAALADEEYFLLLARDPLAPWLVAIWASIRLGDFKSASANYQRMFDGGLLDFYKRNPDAAKAIEAMDVAQRMREWRGANVGTVGQQPRWKQSRALGMERFVISYAERHPQQGAVLVRVSDEEWPTWADSLKPVEPGEPM